MDVVAKKGVMEGCNGVKLFVGELSRSTTGMGVKGGAKLADREQ